MTTARNRGERSITPVATSKLRLGATPQVEQSQEVTQIDRLGRTFSGIDTLHVGLGVRWPKEALAEFVERLDAAKTAAQESDDPTEAVVLIGDREWKVQATGYRLGKDGKGPHVAFRLSRGGVVVGVMKREIPFGNTPNLYILIGSEACLSMGCLDTMIWEIRALCAELGCSIEFEKVSRCDVFTDVEGVEIKDVCRAWMDDRVVCRARKSAGFGMHRNGRRKWEGIQVGRALMFRAYDKIEELKDQPQKRALWNAVEWNDTAPRVVTRFEFEMKREKLAEFERKDGGQGIDTLEHLRANIGEISRYLCERWLRFTKAGVDRQNTTRAALESFWKAVIAAFKSWAGAKRIAERRHRPKVRDCDALIRQARGCIESVAALLGRPKVPKSVQQFAQFARDLFVDQDAREREGMTPHEYAAAVMEKRVVYAARRPLGEVITGVLAT